MYGCLKRRQDFQFEDCFWFFQRFLVPFLPPLVLRTTEKHLLTRERPVVPPERLHAREYGTRRREEWSRFYPPIANWGQGRAETGDTPLSQLLQNKLPRHTAPTCTHSRGLIQDRRRSATEGEKRRRPLQPDFSVHVDVSGWTDERIGPDSPDTRSSRGTRLFSSHLLA